MWTTGTSSSATGLWQTVSASWLGNAAYRAFIPASPVGTYIHYYLRVTEGTNDVCFPTSAPSSNATFFVGTSLQLDVEASPQRFGTATPPYGTNTIISGAPFTVSASSAVIVSNGVRWVCSGWTGTGDVPASGNTNSVTLTLNQNSTLTWLWTCEYALTNRFRLADSGTVFSQDVCWFTANSLAFTETAIELGFVSSTPYALAGWSVDGVRWPDATSTSANPATGILMTRPRTAMADYLPFWLDTDGNGLSDWWERRYFGSATSGVSPYADLDGDGWTNLGEFLDNSDPRNAASTPVPPTISVDPLDAFQTSRPPWTVYAEITDNLSVEVANLVWQERGDTVWITNAMTYVDGNTYQGTINPPSHGAKRVDYYVSAGDLIGYYDSSFCSISPTYHVIGDYDTPWMNVSPDVIGPVELSIDSTNLSLTVSNFAGPDLTWTARLAYAEATFDATHSAWAHTGLNDVWCTTTNRTWNGDPVWYCGDPSSRTYPNSCHALLDTPPFTVQTGGGLVFRQWISTEYDSGNDYWDGAIIGVSTDNGASFTTIAPTTGYPYLITDNPDSPFEGGQPCLAGSGSGWQTLVLDLSAYVGQTVIIRFEFGSDAYTVAEGWYIAGVTPFSSASSAPSWLSPQGTWGGVLPDQWSASVGLTLNPSALAYDEETFACIRFDGNDPSATPIIPLTVRRGHVLTVASTGPGNGSTDRTFLFRDDMATVTLQADTGAYLYALTVNGVPQSGVYDFTVTQKTLKYSHLTENKTLLAWFDYRTWTLTIESPYGTPDPAAGSYTLTHGTVIQTSMSSSPQLETSGLTEYICSGWRQSGLSPASGTGIQSSFALTNDTTLSWQWQTNYWLYALANYHGSVTPPSGWYPAGEAVCVTAVPNTYYHCSAWVGDTYDCAIDGTYITVPMDYPHILVAMFEPTYTATHNVPEYWLASYGWTSNFDAAAESDADGDGMATWKEWRTDTNPTNGLSLLKFTELAQSNQTVHLTWIGGVLRTQLVQAAVSPAGPWSSLYTNLPPTAVSNQITLDGLTLTNRFFRVLVP